ncbi:MAG: hypothetical protein KAU94_00130 [Verrucomicrobia bacterium]|nr:hypothetical protein [Verrucomicrobiota bacterium]
MKKRTLVFLVSALAFTAHAEIFILDFEGDLGTFLDGKSGDTYTTSQNGTTLEITLAAYGTTGIDGFNLTGTGFGINNSESGDDTDAFDDSEYMTLSFNLAGTFQTLELDRMTGGDGDAGSLEFFDGSTTDFSGSFSDPLSIDEAFSKDQIITLRQTVGGSGTTWGFGLEEITVDVVPEPAVVSFIGLTGLGLLIARRFLRGEPGKARGVGQ